MTVPRDFSSLRPRLLALWREVPPRSLSVQRIREALGLPSGQQRALRRLLAELVRDGTLREQGQRYAPAGPARDEAAPAAAALAGESLAEGVYLAHRRGFGFVELDSPRRSVFIPPGQAGGALDGDRVRVAIRKERGGTRDAGEIVAVLDRFRERVRGHLELSRRESWLMPLNDRLPALFLGAAPAPGLRDGDLVEARITAYPQDDEEAPAAEVLERLPDDDSPEGIIEYILADHQVLPGFSPEAEEEASRAARRPITARAREDLRDLPFITIDGEDARDFDDAVCLLPLRGGRRRLLVAIADVAQYVRAGTALDREAFRRGTSIYLPHRALPMLPEVLSNEMCSLRPGEPRFCLTCELELDVRGEATRYRIYESVIRSRARLTYGQVQAFFDTDSVELLPESALAAMLREMRDLAALLREKRQARGALSLMLPELRFELDPQGLPLAAKQVFPNEAMRLIEQFMLETNEQVARHAEAHRLPILYRVHDPPPPDQLESLRLALHNAGVSLEDRDLENGRGINGVLARLESHPRRTQLELAILKAMTQAQYRAHNDGHFGLASDCYAHFTSPIRRYPDLLLHRALKHSWASRGEPARHTERQPGRFRLSPEAGPHLSLRERNAADIEQQVQRLFKVLMMEPHLGEIFPGTVVGLTESGLWVELSGWAVDALLPIDALPPDRYRLERGRNRLRGQRRRPIALGDPLTVRLARADRRAQMLELSFEQWGWRETGPPPRKERQG